MASPFVVGLTGGIGSGKSLVSSVFQEMGIDIIDADQIARDVVAPNSTALLEIANHFGDDFIQPDGHLNRAKMREYVFKNKDAKTWLNQCLHPKIRERMQQGIADSRPPYCVLDVPLLFENNMQEWVDIIIVVDCLEEQQLDRAMKRDGSDAKTIKHIMAAQVSRQTRIDGADIVIDNSNSINATKQQVIDAHKQIQAKLLTNP